MIQAFQHQHSLAAPCMPFGIIESPEVFNQHQVGKLGVPILSGWFNAEKVKARDTKGPMHVGWGCFAAPAKAPVFTFRMQLDEDMLFWLANPGDPAVWDMLEAWDKAGKMALVAELSDGNDISASCDFVLMPPMRAMKPKQFTSESMQHSVRAFFEHAGHMLFTDDLRNRASTDIPHIARLRNVMGCTVTTTSTPRFNVPPELLPFAGCDIMIPDRRRCQLPSV